MSVDKATGVGGVVLGLIGTGVAWLFPSQRWLGWLFLIAGVLLFACAVVWAVASHHTRKQLANEPASNREKAALELAAESEKDRVWAESRAGTLEQRLSALRSDFDDLQIKYDNTKWLRAIADTQASAIDRQVHLEKAHIYCADLMREHPYIEFRFLLSNRSLYDLSFDDLSGSIYFAGYLFSMNPDLAVRPDNDGLGLSQIDLIVRQRLTREDAAAILNRQAAFDCNDLSIRIQSPNFPAVVSKRKSLRPDVDISNIEVREAYPQLTIKFKSAGFYPVSNLQKGLSEDSFITLEIEISNPRDQKIEIDTIRLSTLATEFPRIVSEPDQGDIYEDKVIGKNGDLRHLGNTLKKIAWPFSIIGHGKASGFLQFTLFGVNYGKLRGASGSLTFTDKFGEHHTENCMLKDESGIT